MTSSPGRDFGLAAARDNHLCCGSAGTYGTATRHGAAPAATTNCALTADTPPSSPAARGLPAAPGRRRAGSRGALDRAHSIRADARPTQNIHRPPTQNCTFLQFLCATNFGVNNFQDIRTSTTIEAGAIGCWDLSGT